MKIAFLAPNVEKLDIYHPPKKLLFVFVVVLFHTFLPPHGREYYCHHLYFNSDGVPLTRQSEETRVWQKQSGKWVVVHFHKSNETNSPSS